MLSGEKSPISLSYCFSQSHLELRAEVCAALNFNLREETNDRGERVFSLLADSLSD